MLLVLAATAAIVALVLLSRDPKSDQARVAAVVAVVTVAANAIKSLWQRLRPIEAEPLPLQDAADALAEKLDQQWTTAAEERKLIPETPIPVRWQWCQQVTGPMEAAVGGSLLPLPGLPAITKKDLQSGALKDLLRVYGGLGSGRLVILGQLGAGKSAAGIRLLRDALAHRTIVKPTGQAPVPVLITAPQTWNPTAQPFAEWLAARLVRDYELLRAPQYGPDVAMRLIKGGHLAVILDGLDEMDDEQRSEALRALSMTAVRLVVLTRTEELMTTVKSALLQSAAALELKPINAEQAAEYLANYQIKPPPPSWQNLVDHLRVRRDSVLARALNTPLTLTLVRDYYRPGDKVDELIGFKSAKDIENHLLMRVLTAAYTKRDRSAAPYSVDQAQQWLTQLAHRMNKEKARDLAWWQIPRWAPAWPRVFATIIFISLVSALLTGSLAAPATHMHLLSTFNIGPLIALVAVFGKTLGYAFMFGYGLLLVSPSNKGFLPQQGPFRRSAPDNRTILLLALGVGAGFGLEPGILLGPKYGLAAGLVASLVAGLGFILSGGPPQQLGPFQWSPTDTRTNLLTGLVIGFLSWLVYGLVYGFMYGFKYAFVHGSIVGIIFMLVIVSGSQRSGQKNLLQWGKTNAPPRTLLIGLAIALVSTAGYGFIYILVVTLGGGPPLHGRLRWHKTDTPASILTGLFVGLMYGLAYGFLGGLTGGIAISGLLYGLMFGVVFGFTGGLLLGLGPPTVDAGPLDPPSSWRRERKSGIVVGLAFGLAVGLVYGLTNGLQFGLAVGLVYGLTNGVVAGLGSVLVFSATWAVALTSTQLWLQGEAPLTLLRFLDDARERRILQTAGPMYQFLHTRLQEQLAESHPHATTPPHQASS